MTGYWATVATDGTITASGPFADTEPYVPTGSTIITAEQFATIQVSPGQCRMVNGVLHLSQLPTPTPPDLASYKAAASIQIDTAAEQARLLFLTAGSGQALEYSETLADAQRAVAATGTLDAADYPWLASEQAALHQVGEDVTLLQVAQGVIVQWNAWVEKGAQIKLTRRTAKLRIDAATTFEEVQAALTAASWPTG